MWSTCGHWPAPELTHSRLHTCISKRGTEFVVYPRESLGCSRKALWDSLSAAKVSEAPFWPKVSTPEYILAGLNMDEPLIGLWPKRPFVLCILFQRALIIALTSRHTGERMGTFQSLCAHTEVHRCTYVEGREGYLCFPYILHCVWLLPWSSGSWSWIISQMVTSDLLKIWPITANFHSLLLLSHCFSQLAVTGTKWRQQEPKQSSREGIDTAAQTLLPNNHKSRDSL